MSHKIFELDVRLRGIEPAIWRTLEMPGSSSLEDVHFAIQVAMGWTNSHLHQFDINGTHYGMVDVDEAAELEDERAYSLEDLVRRGSSFVYEYDFGDGWEHDVKVMKVTTVSLAPHARCTAGARACPPEDCGGPGGYANLLQALVNPKHKEHQSLVEWSDGFEPERFTLPTKGKGLRAEMAELKKLANDDDGDELGESGGMVTDLPKSLVESVLALPPMARASMAALIAGSLADEVEHARSVVQQVMSAARAPKRGRHGTGRKRNAR
ncbi:MAG: plasmid pRiA4b ORF-3 family protein [Deltaproteobacteria bacterium]|nr:plasmid pRiA4b ORF-3 family protein [Deltaproteobacteria bacterium]